MPTRSTAVPNPSVGPAAVIPARPVWLSLWFALLLLSLVLAGIGAAVYLSARRTLTESVHQNLESIARIKAGQIERWFGDAHRQADLALNSPLFIGELERWLAAGMPPAGRPRLLKHLQVTAAVGRLRDVGLRSTLDGRLLLSTDPVGSDHAEQRGRALLAAADQAPVLEDFHVTDHGRAGVGLGFHTPLGRANERPLAVAHVELDPAVHLLPFLNQWPGASPSAETLLFRIDGAEIVYLNHLRHDPRAALEMRQPVGAKALLGAQVARGALGGLRGVDYRDVDSLGYALPVAGTPWYLVAKIDESEALAALDRTSLLAAAATVGLMIMFIGWKLERGRHLESEYRTLFERALLSRRIEFLARYANDGILLADTGGRIIEVNELCADIYGYRREEMLGMQLAALWSVPDLPPADLMPAEDRIGEAEHRRKDGAAIAVEISSRMIDIDGVRYFQALVRDNRHRKQYEQSLRASEERFRLTFDHAPIGMLMLGLDGRILAVNAACCAMSGYAQAELLTMTLLELTHPDERAGESDWLERLIASEPATCSVTKRVVRKDGEARLLAINRTLVRDGGGNPMHVVSQVRDITEERKSAARIERLSQLKAALSEINHAIVHSVSPAEVLRAVCHACVDRGGFRLAWIGVPDAASERVQPVHAYGPAVAYLDGLVCSTGPDTPEGRGPVGMIVRGQRRYRCNDCESDAAFAPWRDRARAHGLASMVAVSLKRGGQPWGVLAGYGAETHCFDDEAVEMLQSMADNISFALDQFDREVLRRQAEESLRTSEQRAMQYAQELDDLYQNAPCGYHSCDASGVVRRMNDTELRWLGYTRAEVVDRMKLGDLLEAVDRAQFPDRFQRFMQDGQVHDLELTLVRKDGTSLPVMISATAIYDDEGRFVASRTTVRDLTRVKALERDRDRQAYRLQQLSRHLVAVQEEERRRLACELQDRASPNLAAIKLTLDTLMHALPDAFSADADAYLGDARALLEDTISGVREVCADLRPSMLDYGGLVPAVVGYTQQYTRRTGIAVGLRLPNERVRFGAEMESTLFRIIQEALSNVGRHANAASAEVEIDSDERRTVLRIRDDGVGFDPAGAPDEGSRGLRSMRQRAEFSGGSLQVVSSPGKGTEIRVELRTPRDTTDSPWYRLVAADGQTTLQ